MTNTTRITVEPTTEIIANVDERTITGMLIPFGEVGRTNAGPIIVEAEHIDIPADPVVVGLNLDHAGPRAGIGPAFKVWKEPTGIMATFSVARTPAGDAALADARDPNGKRRALSGEFDVVLGEFDPTANARRSRPGGVLWGAALVERGAFPSARVLAEEVTSEDHSETVYTDENGKTYRRVYDSVTTEEQTDDGTETTITTTITEEETEADAEVETEEETTVTATAVPATHRSGAPLATANARQHDLQTVFAAFAAAKDAFKLGGRAPEDATAVLAALSDITITGPGSLPVGGDVLQENWVGQLYQGIPYERQYINLGTLGTNITAAGKKGYTLERGTAGAPVTHFDGTWAGNKTPINSGVGFTASAASELFRFAFGVDIAREFFDLPGGAEVVEAFLRLIAEDHLVWSDEIALDTWVSVAGAPIAPSTYPGTAGHEYADAIGMMIQGILAVKAKKADGRRDVPTFAIANELAYEQLVYSPKDQIPEFVTFGANTSEGITADGLRVVVGDTGIEDTPSVIVGSSKAVEFDELAGGPLHIDALDLAKGGIDKAIHGYLQRFIVRPEAVVHVGVVDA
ncbi:hypothetical protein M0722_01545 [Microbacterium sp. KSW4-16]|uniref:hypothetical protein n=1 Tax=Microbacterium aurugineum TaxID=2851642 RepID=UPI0020BE3582|nr:hypothetical protein [Microbacterium aurugineum]MCK8465866.1 hypothetical protein [Microbacterium aurugineum]